MRVNKKEQLIQLKIIAHLFSRSNFSTTVLSSRNRIVHAKFLASHFRVKLSHRFVRIVHCVKINVIHIVFFPLQHAPQNTMALIDRLQFADFIIVSF